MQPQKRITYCPTKSKVWYKLQIAILQHDILDDIVKRSSSILNIPLKNNASIQIASRSRGTPRIANALLRIRSYAQVKGDGVITNDITQIALNALQVDKHGLDEMNHKILLAIIDKYKGGPVGISTLATVVGEESGRLKRCMNHFWCSRAI